MGLSRQLLQGERCFAGPFREGSLTQWQIWDTSFFAFSHSLWATCFSKGSSHELQGLNSQGDPSALAEPLLFPSAASRPAIFVRLSSPGVPWGHPLNSSLWGPVTPRLEENIPETDICSRM